MKVLLKQFQFKLDRLSRWIVVAFLAVALSACDTAEERAENHYRKGLALVEAGELEKAGLEFRNALRLNEDATAPRLEFAKVLFAQRDLRGAAENLQLVIEAAPKDIEAQRHLGLIYVLANQLDAAAPHVNAAYALAPDDLEVRTLKATFDFRQGQIDQAATLARAILEDHPNNGAATLVLAEHALNSGAYAEALDVLDPALAANPQDFGLHITKTKVLEALDDQAALGAQVRLMYQTFPENAAMGRALVQWHLGQGDIPSAEEVLRNIAARNPLDSEAALNVVSFRNTHYGIDAAREELAVLVGKHPDRAAYVRGLAELDIREGKSDEAIDRLDAMLAEPIEGGEQITTQLMLAQILGTTGQKARANGIIAQVLQNDPKNVDALMLRAREAIGEDRPEDAISDLRTALDGSPQNPAILTLLAQAHERNGSRGLAQERLALAVRASDNGVAESLRYSQFLARDGKFDVADGVLRTSLDKNPGTPRLMGGIAQLYLQQSQWEDADAIVQQLRAMQGDTLAATIADEIQISALNGQRKFDESLGVLRQMWADAGEKTSAMENLVRTYLRSGKADDAAVFLNGILESEPSNMRANLLLGAVHAFKDEGEAAEARYRKVIAEHPEHENGYGALAALLSSTGRQDEADSIILEGIETSQNTARLLFLRAARFEQTGDFEGAIAIYEQLYIDNKVSDVLANNLASLLSDHRDDTPSIERAYAVAKRLRGTTNPAFQDTYGWVLHRWGDHERALTPLRAASEAMPNVPLVQYHLGVVYQTLEQNSLAKAQFEKVVLLEKNAQAAHAIDARVRLESLVAQ